MEKAKFLPNLICLSEKIGFPLHGDSLLNHDNLILVYAILFKKNLLERNNLERLQSQQFQFLSIIFLQKFMTCLLGFIIIFCNFVPIYLLHCKFCGVQTFKI